MNLFIFLGKKPESIGSKIQAVLNDAIWSQPSIVILDDLDQIAAASLGPDQETAPEMQYFARVGQGCVTWMHINKY